MDVKSVVVVLVFGLVLSFMVDDSEGQNLRWGKRDGLEEKYEEELRNKRQNLRWGKRNDLKEDYAGESRNKRQNLRWGKRDDFDNAGELRNKRQNLRWGKREDLNSEFLELLRRALMVDSYEEEQRSMDGQKGKSNGNVVN